MQTICHKFSSYDKFTAGRPALKIDFEGQGAAYKSYMGAFISIVFIVITLAFFYIKCLTLYNSSHIVTTDTLAEKVIGETEKFTSEQDFFVAAALTAYNNEAELPPDLHRYGKFEFYHIGWGNNSNENHLSGYENQLNSHACSAEELGLEPGTEFPVVEESRNEVEIWFKKFRCVDEADYVIWGNYNTAHANTFVVGFMLCEGEENDCHD